jgi:hypothetical protein
MSPDVQPMAFWPGTHNRHRAEPRRWHPQGEGWADAVRVGVRRASATAIPAYHTSRRKLHLG